MDVISLTAAQLWLPGEGLVPPDVRAARQAVREYDEDLTLGRHEHTGDWVVLLKRGPEGRPFPVFGLGVELPPPEQIKKKLSDSDVRRNGARITEQIVRRKELHDKEVRRQAEEGSGEAAEAVSWAHRQMGSHPSPRIFVPDSKGAN